MRMEEHVTVIVVTQDMADRGDRIIADIARCLDLDLVHQEKLATCIAERMLADKQVVRRLIDGRLSFVEHRMSGRRRLFHCLAREIIMLAAQGNVVIQGSAAADLLRPVKHVIRVHLYTPMHREKRERPNWETSARAYAIGLRFSVDRIRCWGHRQGRELSRDCDLALNTERISIAECVEHVRALARGPQLEPTRLSCEMLEEMGRQFENSGPSGQVDVGPYTVRLYGAASDESAIATVEDHLRGKEACNEMVDCRPSLLPQPPQTFLL
jgi:hypothetical protein